MQALNGIWAQDEGQTNTEQEKSKQNVREMNIIFYKLKSMSHLQNLDHISRLNGIHCADGRRDSAMNKSFISHT